MKYYYYIWNKETNEYTKNEINSNEAYITLARYYRTSLVKRLQGKPFRLRTPIGWIETENQNGTILQSGFYGIAYETTEE